MPASAGRSCALLLGPDRVSFAPAFSGFGTAGTLVVGGLKASVVSTRSDHRVDVIFQFRDFTASFHENRARQVTLRHRRRHFGDGANLRCQIRSQ